MTRTFYKDDLQGANFEPNSVINKFKKIKQ